MAVSDRAFQAEEAAFKAIQAKVKQYATAFVLPAGAGKGFPDFGFAFVLPNGKKIDAHIEYKLDAKAQMGSMRDWRFTGQKFYSPDMQNDQKTELIALMNNTPIAISNAKRILDDLKKYFSKDVTEISSGTLSVVKDKFVRRLCTENFIKNSKNYVIANISSATLGGKIVSHYKDKFAKSIRRNVDGSLLLMMIGKDIWMVDVSGRVTDADVKIIGTLMGAKQNMRTMTSLSAKLECRIQPRGLSAPATNPKPTFIDVMASYRLDQKPSGGVTIL